MLLNYYPKLKPYGACIYYICGEMWQRIAVFTLKNRLAVLIIIALGTCIMGFFALKLALSYEPTAAIPKDSQEYKTYLAFKNLFGEDGNLIVLGFTPKKLNDTTFFNEYRKLCANLRKVKGIENAICVPEALNIKKSTDSATLISKKIFPNNTNLDSSLNEFYNLPFYQNFLYNTESGAQLIALRINKDIMRSEKRVPVVNELISLGNVFGATQNVEMHYSGLPLIRSLIAVKIQKEMRLFLIVSLLLTAAILFLFFRNLGVVFYSLLVVVTGVVWSCGLMQLLGYKISILTALIPPLLIVIGIPNCIYFLNKYHQEFARTGLKAKSLVLMVKRMGVVTLFTNLTAAIGFGVFCFTSSTILKEFGAVAFLGILMVFFISLFAIPALFSYLSEPQTKHTNYLDNPWLIKILNAIEILVYKKRTLLYLSWLALLLIGGIGLVKLRSEGKMVDDLPASDKIALDLKYFEKNFKGVMPLEIWIDTKRKGGAISLGTLNKMEELSSSIAGMPNMAKPLSVLEAVKFVRQAYYDGDSLSYALPTSFDAAFLQPYLKMKGNGKDSFNQIATIVKSFVDSQKQTTRLSVNMADVGSKVLPTIIDSIKRSANQIFDSSRYTIHYTGASVVFLEGSKFIINSLGESIAYAFLLILVCMIFLFRQWRIVLMSIVANIIPLLITAGIMGWFNIPLKPSTVLVFSVALGITIDVTIRFLVAYKQELPRYNFNIKEAVRATIHDTGISIIYTSLILIAGFCVFVLSKFGGTQALGYLTSLTLLLSMLINLTILPAFLLWMDKSYLKKAINDPLWEVINEEDDTDLNKLKLEE